MKKLLGTPPKRTAKKNMLTSSSPKDVKLVNFECTSDFVILCKGYVAENNMTLKQLFTKGAELYMEENE